ncbi:MAG: tetratricopeptide repeat protein [Pseudomonadota bacterium]
MSSQPQNAAAIQRLLQQAAALQQQQRPMDAAYTLEQVLSIDPAHYVALTTLAQIALAAGRIDICANYAQRAHQSNANGYEALAVLAECHQRNGDTAGALDCMRRIRSLRPDDARVNYNIAILEERQDNSNAAADAYERALALDPDHHDARANLAMLRLAQGDDATALAHCAERLQRLRGSDSDVVKQEPASKFKLQMDLEQLNYLREHDRLPDAARELPEALAAVVADLDEAGDDEVFALPHPKYHWKSHWAIAAKHHNRPLHVPDVTLPDGPLINPDLDIDGLTTTYHESEPNVVVVDNLLTPAALDAVLRFCREATIWFDLRQNYVGAYFVDGFANALTLGIARELEQALPGIFAGHSLTQAWGYKYGAALSGIGMHADAAAVNSNFWIAPDAANRDPERGGLLIYRKAAPMAWSFEQFNNDEVAMRDFLGDALNDPIRIPHKQNRIVIFNSNLFHRTDDIQFGNSFLERRYNMTLLFGRRGR